jgi:hypothetical protein
MPPATAPMAAETGPNKAPAAAPAAAPPTMPSPDFARDPDFALDFVGCFAFAMAHFPWFEVDLETTSFRCIFRAAPAWLSKCNEKLYNNYSHMRALVR